MPAPVAVFRTLDLHWALLCYQCDEFLYAGTWTDAMRLAWGHVDTHRQAYCPHCHRS